jgi:acyl carrier protein
MLLSLRVRPEDLRDALDLDSMNSLNFVVALHERESIDIPEADYPRLRSLGGPSPTSSTPMRPQARSE